MASGGDQIIPKEENKFCTPCTAISKPVPYQHYCLDCDAFYCDECFVLHLRVPLLSQHVVLCEKDVELFSTLQYKCQTHGKAFEFFCSEHSQPCCHICVSLQHKACDNVSYIPEQAKDKRSLGEVQSLLKQDALQTMQQHKQKFQRKLATNELSKETCLKKIKAHRQSINSYLDAMENRTIQEMKRVYDENKKLVEEKIRVIGKLRNDIEMYQRQLTASPQRKDVLITLASLERTTVIKKTENQLMAMDHTRTKEDLTSSSP